MKKCIVLGGTYDHIRLIEILKEKGYYTVLVDYLEYPPAFSFADEHIRESTLDLEIVLKIAKEIKPELIVTTSIDQTLLTMAFVCEKLNLPCHITYQTALELTNKALMKIKFTANKIPTSNFAIVNKKGEMLHENLEFPLVVKPVDSNSSKGITKVISTNKIEAAINHAISESKVKKAIIEEYIEGEELSVDVIVSKGIAKVILVTKTLKMVKNENSFTIIQSYFPATTDTVFLSNINTIIEKIVVTYKIWNSPLVVQLINKNGELLVIEFSARLGGGSKHYLIKLITGIDVQRWFIDILLLHKNEIQVTQNYAYACVNYLYCRNGVIGKYENFEALQKEGIIFCYFLYKQLGYQVTNHLSSSDRVGGYIIVENDSQLFNIKMNIARDKLDIMNHNNESIIIK